MGIVLLIVAGGAMGWLAAIITRSDNLRAILQNIGAGIAGALVAGLLISPLIGAGNLLAGQHEVLALLVSLCGSIVVLAAVNFPSRDATH